MRRGPQTHRSGIQCQRGDEGFFVLCNPQPANPDGSSAPWLNLPVREELQNIENNLNNFDRLSIFIDDVRCFNPAIPEYADYPSLDYLVDWSRRNGLTWHIEHDIFVMKSKF